MKMLIFAACVVMGLALLPLPREKDEETKAERPEERLFTEEQVWRRNKRYGTVRGRRLFVHAQKALARQAAERSRTSEEVQALKPLGSFLQTGVGRAGTTTTSSSSSIITWSIPWCENPEYDFFGVNLQPALGNFCRDPVKNWIELKRMLTVKWRSDLEKERKELTEKIETEKKRVMEAGEQMQREERAIKVEHMKTWKAAQLDQINKLEAEALDEFEQLQTSKYAQWRTDQENIFLQHRRNGEARFKSVQENEQAWQKNIEDMVVYANNEVARGRRVRIEMTQGHPTTPARQGNSVTAQNGVWVEHPSDTQNGVRVEYRWETQRQTRIVTEHSTNGVPAGSSAAQTQDTAGDAVKDPTDTSAPKEHPGSNHP